MSIYFLLLKTNKFLNTEGHEGVKNNFILITFFK